MCTGTHVIATSVILPQVVPTVGSDGCESVGGDFILGLSQHVLTNEGWVRVTEHCKGR